MNFIQFIYMGQPRWPSGLAPRSARGVILETWDQVPHRAPCMKPVSPSACVSACYHCTLQTPGSGEGAAPTVMVGRRASALLRTHPLPLGLAAGTVSVTAAFLSSSSFSYPESYGQRKGNQSQNSWLFRGTPSYEVGETGYCPYCP